MATQRATSQCHSVLAHSSLTHGGKMLPQRGATLPATRPVDKGGPEARTHLWQQVGEVFADHRKGFPIQRQVARQLPEETALLLVRALRTKPTRPLLSTPATKLPSLGGPSRGVLAASPAPVSSHRHHPPAASPDPVAWMARPHVLGNGVTPLPDVERPHGLTLGADGTLKLAHRLSLPMGPGLVDSPCAPPLAFGAGSSSTTGLDLTGA